ncbi:MAG: PASTA domain-containing protein [Candidatus Aminicenantaceae bacterium]
MPSKKLFKYLLFLLLILNLFFLSATVTHNLVLKGEMVKVPDLIGKTLQEAKLELTTRRLSLSLRGAQFSDQWEKGKIALQEPSPGSKIEFNKAVRVYLSAGSERVIVPDIEGRMLKSASQILTDVDLKKGKTTQVHTFQYAAGKIIAQQPSSSTEVGRNSAVNLLVSQGEREKKYLMPDLIGRRYESVKAKLEEMDFRVGVVRYSYYPGLDPGIIIKQLPPHGYRVQKRNLITLEVSK